jgi:hypothetical protein
MAFLPRPKNLTEVPVVEDKALEEEEEEASSDEDVAVSQEWVDRDVGTIRMD